ncbi:hypothetical protein [Loktanella sp. DSM 29012]|uniref:hypothetical protein n=1 Tax=Loktanella sp. DSM 29012 TaxID=1881056 RepID=UPI00115FF19D|nr:hypothetical protein [Loktanella sp. DSM 29012]
MLDAELRGKDTLLALLRKKGVFILSITHSFFICILCIFVVPASAETPSAYLDEYGAPNYIKAESGWEEVLKSDSFTLDMPTEYVFEKCNLDSLWLRYFIEGDVVKMGKSLSDDPHAPILNISFNCREVTQDVVAISVESTLYTMNWKYLDLQGSMVLHGQQRLLWKFSKLIVSSNSDVQKEVEAFLNFAMDSLLQTITRGVTTLNIYRGSHDLFLRQ